MATRIVVPDAGQTTDELLLAKWYVDAGDEVEVGDFLADIETDKAVGELESHAAGHVLKLLVEEGDTVTTGQALLWLGEPGEEVPEEPEDPSEPEQAPPAATDTELATAEGVVADSAATPAARVIARDRGVDLGSVTGTGPDGCIVKRDVLAVSTATGGRAVPLSPMRRAIAERLQQNVREAPHFYVSIDVDMTHALVARDESKVDVSINDLVVKAVADTLADFPEVNCRLDDDTLHYLDEVNIGIAVSVEEGLVVPVLKRADRLSLAEVGERSRRLIEAARSGRLAAGVQSTFTVSNLGMYGVKSFSAIINPPEAAILAVGALDERLALRDAGVVAVPTVNLTLSSDHRIIDGVVAARLLAALKRRIEDSAAWRT